MFVLYCRVRSERHSLVQTLNLYRKDDINVINHSYNNGQVARETI